MTITKFENAQTCEDSVLCEYISSGEAKFPPSIISENKPKTGAKIHLHMDTNPKARGLQSFRATGAEFDQDYRMVPMATTQLQFRRKGPILHYRTQPITPFPSPLSHSFPSLSHSNVSLPPNWERHYDRIEGHARDSNYWRKDGERGREKGRGEEEKINLITRRGTSKSAN